MQLVLMLAAALLFATGGLCMKFSDGMTRLAPSLGIFLCFCSGAALQTLAMRRAEMGVVYLLVLGFEALTAFALSAVFLQERLSMAKGCALVLVLAGLILLERTS